MASEPLAEVNPGQNGIVLNNEESAGFVGLGKEELLTISQQPLWKGIRLALLIIFWVIWALLLISVVYIVYSTPGGCTNAVPVEQRSALYIADKEVLNDIKDKKLQVVVPRKLQGEKSLDNFAKKFLLIQNVTEFSNLKDVSKFQYMSTVDCPKSNVSINCSQVLKVATVPDILLPVKIESDQTKWFIEFDDDIPLHSNIFKYHVYGALASFPVFMHNASIHNNISDMQALRNKFDGFQKEPKEIKNENCTLTKDELQVFFKQKDLCIVISESGFPIAKWEGNEKCLQSQENSCDPNSVIIMSTVDSSSTIQLNTTKIQEMSLLKNSLYVISPKSE